MKKYIGRIIIETESILVVGSGESELDNKGAVAKDFNNLPYIPGTGISGVLAHIFEKEKGEPKRIEYFGGEDEESKNEDETLLGSNVEISDAYLMDEDGNVYQQIVPKSKLKPYYKKFLKLPRREHVKLDHRGTAEENGKFDNEYVYKGTRFKFELSLMDEDDNIFNTLLKCLYTDNFRFGSGTTNGYGQVKIIKIEIKTFDLQNEQDFIEYLDFTCDLNVKYDGWEIFKPETNNYTWKRAKLKLTFRTLFIGAGYGDIDVDEINYREEVIEWNDNKPHFENYYVIPGSSVKGVLAHEVAFLKNQNDGITIEKYIKTELESEFTFDARKILLPYNDKFYDILTNDIDIRNQISQLQSLKSEIVENISNNNSRSSLYLNYTSIVGSENEDVKNFFGIATAENMEGEMGKLICNDIYIPYDDVQEVIFDHNAIDRFTGGTMDTALYSEKVLTLSNEIEFNYQYTDIAEFENTNLSKALLNIENGIIAIGGKTNKGYGFNQANNN